MNSLPTTGARFSSWAENVSAPLTCNSGDMIGAICLQSVLDSGLLTIICSVITSRVNVVAEPNSHVDFRLNNGLQLNKAISLEVREKARNTHHKSRDIAICSIETDTLRAETVNGDPSKGFKQGLLKLAETSAAHPR